jgi:hypothetical protein
MEISEISPQNLKASVSIVDLNYRLGKTTAAEKEIDRFIGQYDPASEASNIKDYLETLKTEVSGEDHVIRQLVSFYKSQGQIEKAITELDSLGDMLLGEGRKDDAVAVIEEIISLEPSNVTEYEKLLEQLKS